MKRAFCIVNPNAGGGRTGRTFDQWRPAVEQALGPCEFVQTAAHGDGVRLAAEAAKLGHQTVVAFGGDGTVNEIVTGLRRAEACDVTLGVVAQGTGGDFRRSLGLSHRIDRYLEVIRAGHRVRVDVGEVRYQDHQGGARSRHFVNVLSAGMGGLVDQYVAQSSRTFGATAAYFGATLRALQQIRRSRVQLRGEGPDGAFDVVVPSLMVAVCNGQYFGSGMHIAPHAALDDGCLEVVALDAPSKLGFALFAKDIYRGTHIEKAATFRAFQLEMSLLNDDAGDTFLLDVDGEPLGRLPLQLKLQRQALQVFAPRA